MRCRHFSPASNRDDTSVTLRCFFALVGVCRSKGPYFNAQQRHLLCSTSGEGGGLGVAFPAQVTRKKYGLMKEEAFSEPPVMCRRVFMWPPTVSTCCGVGEKLPRVPQFLSAASEGVGVASPLPLLLRLGSNRLFLSWPPAGRSPASGRMSHGGTAADVNLTLESSGFCRSDSGKVLRFASLHHLERVFVRKCFQLQVDTSAAANTFTLTRSIRVRLSSL